MKKRDFPCPLGSQTVNKWLNRYVITDWDEQCEGNKQQAVLEHIGVQEPPLMG